MLKITSPICDESNHIKIFDYWMEADGKFIKVCFEIKCVDDNCYKFDGHSEKKLGGI